jgi:hypothetical protein
VRMGSRGDRWAAVLAFAAHGVALGLMLRVAPRVRHTASLTDTTALEVDVDVSDGLSPLPESHQAPAAPESAVASREPSQRHPGAARIPGEGSAAPMGSSVVTGSPGATWTFSPLQAPDLAAISLGTVRYEGAPEATDDSPAHSADRAFAEANEHDVELGLGRGGPVRSAVEEVVRDGEVLGTAMFDVTLDHAGVVRVDLVHAVGASDVWDHLRDPIARLVAKKGVRIPEHGRGLRVRVSVEAASKLADGRDVRSLGTSARGTIGEPGTETVAMKEMPNVGIEHRGVVGSVKVAIGLTGGDSAANTNFGTDNAAGGAPMAPGITPLTIGGAFSPENIGSSPTRVVAARVVRETRL